MTFPLLPLPPQGHWAAAPSPEDGSPQVVLSLQLPSLGSSDFSIPVYLEAVGFSALLNPATTLVNNPLRKLVSTFQRREPFASFRDPA